MTNYSTLPIMGIRSHLVTEMATNHDRNQPVLKIELVSKKTGTQVSGNSC